MTDRPPFHPDDDPVRVAVRRYRQRFADINNMLLTDATAAAYFTMLERVLVMANIAMQDEGLDPDARNRVISAGLNVTFDDGEALRRAQETRSRIELAECAPVPPMYVAGRNLDDMRIEPQP